KAEKPEDNIDPLSQLAIEGEGVKGKRKKKTDAAKISIHIPNKGDSFVAGDVVEEAIQPSLKKRKVNEKVASEMDAATVVSEAIPPPAPRRKMRKETLLLLFLSGTLSSTQWSSLRSI
ncbi:hypothetical protein A2U01_0062371, partial [Trifolium medium]|nr:hypothetical protein [Trifolium medium]